MLFNLFRRKPQKQKVDLSQLEDSFILNLGTNHCDNCKDETANCCKIDVYDQCVCICPRKDIKGFYRPKK